MAEVPLPTPTDNPVPSTDIRDAVYAGAMLDKVVTSTDLTYTDRLGGEHYTVDGMKAEGDKVVEETRQNLIPLSRQYMTLAAAQADIANIPVNSTTYVRSADGSALADEYQNVSGTLTKTGKSMPTSAFVRSVDEYTKERLPDYSPVKGRVALIVGDGADPHVAAWEEDGKWNSIPLHDDLVGQITAGLAKEDDLNRSVPTLDNIPKKVALIIGDGADPHVAAWEEDGKWNSIPLHDDLVGQILSEITPLLPKNRAKNSDGGTMWLYHSKEAKLDLGMTTRLKIGFTGDSWTEHKTIPQVFADYFYARYGKSGDGWIQLNIDNANQLNGIVLTRANWSIYDASTTGNAPPFPTSMDGQYIFSSATNSTIDISNLFTSTLQLFYYDGDGSFTYSINGGAETTINCAGTNAVKSVTISGFNIAAASTVHVGTVPNTGTVVIYGFYANGTGKGVEVNKMGNGGITAPQYVKTLPYLSQTASAVAPDLLLMIISTNDYRTGVSLQAFRDGLTSWVQAWKAIIPDSALILIPPPQCNATGPNPLSSFRDIMIDVAISEGIEYFSLYDYINTTWAKANAQGIWNDSLHMNSVGARILLNHLRQKYLEG